MMKVPQVRVNDRAAARLRSGHVWVYASDVLDTGLAEPGALVHVIGPKEKPLGSAIFSSASQIRLRLLGRELLGAEEDLLHFMRQRLSEAVAYRELVVSGSEAYRLIFSEADGLPGLIVDRYNDIIAMQVLTQAWERPQRKQAIVDAIRELTHTNHIVERVDPRIRELEDLPQRESHILYGEKTRSVFEMNFGQVNPGQENRGQITREEMNIAELNSGEMSSGRENSSSTTTEISAGHNAGVRFHYDALTGQKTGAFLDQRENYAAAAAYARGEALDVCTYQGGFALHLARVCEKVTALDISREVLEVAEENEKLNAAPDRPNIEWIEANAFELLKDYAAAARQYDVIVLDPPAFAKSKRNLPAAMRGYKELNLRALRMLRSGGTLVTCSCSFAVSEEEFLAMLASAAQDAHRSVRVMERRGQSRDHPLKLGIPETNYLKCVIASVT